MANIKGDPLDLLLRIQQAQSGEDYGTGMYSRARGVGFTLGDINLVLPLSDIREIVTVSDLTPVPGVKDWVLGVSSVRGNVVTVVDLPEYLGIPSRPVRGSLQVIVINARGFRTAIRVTRILGLRLLPEASDDSVNVQQAMPDNVRSLVKREFQLEDAVDQVSAAQKPADDDIWGEFDLRALAAREDFINVARETAA